MGWWAVKEVAKGCECVVGVDRSDSVGEESRIRCVGMPRRPPPRTRGFQGIRKRGRFVAPSAACAAEGFDEEGVLTFAPVSVAVVGGRVEI